MFLLLVIPHGHARPCLLASLCARRYDVSGDITHASKCCESCLYIFIHSCMPFFPLFGNVHRQVSINMHDSDTSTTVTLVGIK